MGHFDLSSMCTGRRTSRLTRVLVRLYCAYPNPACRTCVPDGWTAGHRRSVFEVPLGVPPFKPGLQPVEAEQNQRQQNTCENLQQTGHSGSFFLPRSVSRAELVSMPATYDRQRVARTSSGLPVFHVPAATGRTVSG